jgi:ATP-dependent RNA helicase DeaD
MDTSITFKDLGLTDTLIQTLEQIGYETPTAIQAQAIPTLLNGHDMLGMAQTGTGKTAAFALPTLDKNRHHTTYNPSVGINTHTRTSDSSS